MDESELEEYFKSDKSSWYQIDSKGDRLWDKEKVNEFWKLFFNNITYKGVVFLEDYVFPEFRLYDLLRNNKDEGFLENNTLFGETVFLKNVTFQGGFIIEDLEIEDTLTFEKCEFEDFLILDSCKMHIVDFNDTLFRGPISFYQTEFNEYSQIYESKFLNKVSFSEAIFNDEFLIFKSRFESLVDFDYTTFKSNFQISYCKFSNLHFTGSKYNDGQIEISYLEGIGLKKIVFNDMKLSENFIIGNSDTSIMSFESSDVSKTYFYNCNWNITNRLLVLDEFWYSDDLNKTDALKRAESVYRQLKLNFDSKKNWELSGAAYISEMEMRKKRLWNENKFYQWFIYWFYGFFGGYTQDFKKPIVWLFSTIILCSIFYYSIDNNILKALQRGINGAIPYLLIDTKNPFEGWWLLLRNIQFLFSSILLTFFILALRKRFKQ